MAAAGDAGRAGDSVANATHDLYRQYGKQIYAYCLHQLRSREEAEDAVQTTFLNAFRGLQRGTTTRFEQAWLYKIALNVCIARRSSSGKRLHIEAPDDFEILEEIVPSGSGSADDTLELMGLEDALEQMPENQRRAILLREWQGLSYREIASQLDLSQGAVEMLIFRARRTLATALEEPTAAKQRTGKAKTGFSFGSLIAAMKGLFSTGAALKMAAVAVSAAVVTGTNAVHSVVHRATTPRHTHTAAAPQVRQVSSAPQLARSSSVELVAFRTSRTKLAATGSPAAPTLTGGTSSRKPVLADDVAATTSGSGGPATIDQPSVSEPASAAQSVSLVAPPAAVNPTPSGTKPSPAPTTSASGGSESTGSSQGSSDSGTSAAGSSQRKDGAGGNGKNKGIGTHKDPPSSPPTTTTASDSGDSSTSSDVPAPPQTITSSTTTPPPPPTTTTSDGGDNGSNRGSSSSESSGDSGHGHGGGNGNGGDGHHSHGH